MAAAPAIEPPIEVAKPEYWALMWLARHGTHVPLVSFLLIGAAAAALADAMNDVRWLIAGVLIGTIAAGLMRVLLEIVRLLVDTLIPQ